jgi:phosphatidylethanolamine-binding protein
MYTMFRGTGLICVLAMSLRAFANDHTANSVSTLDFKNRFMQSGIVPEVIAGIDPSVSFYAAYKAEDSENSHDELLVPGSSLRVSEATMPFEFSVEGLNNATNITAQTRFLIYLVS